MNKVTVTIEDTDEGLAMQGNIEDTEAFNKPPTPALILGSYLAANAEKICTDAVAWFKQEIVPKPGVEQ